VREKDRQTDRQTDKWIETESKGERERERGRAGERGVSDGEHTPPTIEGVRLNSAERVVQR
jgi:hypothetical protein